MTRFFKDKRLSKSDSGTPSFQLKEKNAVSMKQPNLPLVRPSALGVWHVDAAELEGKILSKDGRTIEPMVVEDRNVLVEKKKELGDILLIQYARDYESSNGRNGDMKMVMATRRSGTEADKVSAFSVMVADNPIANMKSLDALLSMVTSKVGKRHALVGFEALKELFISSLLPDRKLKRLFQRPITYIPETKDGHSLLLFWYWEELLKQRYERFVCAVEEASRDLLPVLKDKALKTLYMLLKCKPEQEHTLLSSLVNKLGDPEGKAASNADFHLLELLQFHPNMKAVVIDEVDSFIFRPHLGLRAKYHAVNFLSQIHLTHKGDGHILAKRLMDLYFAVFKVMTVNVNNGAEYVKSSKKKQTKTSAGSDEPHVGTDSRILSALLTGVNRAFPFVNSDEIDDIITVQIPILFRLVHSSNFNVGIEALMLLHKISSKNQVASDRFYRALYSKLLLPAAMSTSKVEIFFGLLRSAMKSDINPRRVAAFSKRLLQVATQVTPQYACGCLFLLSEILKARPPLWKMMLQNESNEDDGLEHFQDINDDEAEVRDATRVSSVDECGNGEVDNPGGYNARLREPSYCNADRVTWWELTVLASHVHPSVSVMARTLLSGAYIVYNGNPLNDLSLIAFLDKFMEKKPRENTWHGGSDIAPANKVQNVNVVNRLIGAEILSLEESEVPPEDVVFHRFYKNKLASTHKKKKKKKQGDDGDDDFVDYDDGHEVADGDYDYDDLDKIAMDDDDDLTGEVSDAEDGAISPLYSEEDKDERIPPPKGKKGVSPFAKFEDYEGVMDGGQAMPKRRRIN